MPDAPQSSKLAARVKTAETHLHDSLADLSQFSEHYQQESSINTDNTDSSLITRPLRKLALESVLQEETEHRTGMYTRVHEDSSTVSTKQDAAAVESLKRSTKDSHSSQDLQILQLMLQYRLNNHEALRALVQCQKALCQLLGVNALASQEVNFERLAYALGSDDFHLLLTMLNQLTDALFKLLSRLEHKQQHRKSQLTKKQVLERQKPMKGFGRSIVFLQTSIAKQGLFCQEIRNIYHDLEEIEGGPQLGETLDEVAAIEGPISRFSQALRHGMVLSGSLYQQLHLDHSANLELQSLLTRVDQVLNRVTEDLQPQQFFTPRKQLVGQDLEQRATAKRLRNFFG